MTALKTVAEWLLVTFRERWCHQIVKISPYPSFPKRGNRSSLWKREVRRGLMKINIINISGRHPTEAILLITIFFSL